MDRRVGSDAARGTILELVGHGATIAEIRDRLGAYADEQDLRYAHILVKVRDEIRAEKPRFEPKKAHASRR